MPSPNNKVLMKLFRDICRENEIMSDPNDCFTYLHEFPQKYEQMSLFDNVREKYDSVR